MDIEQKIILNIVEDAFYLEKVDTTNVNWDKIVDFLIEKILVVFLYPRIRKYIVSSKIDDYDRIYDKLYQDIERQVEEIKKIQRQLDSQEIGVMFVKGALLSKIAYDDFYVRQCSDIDFLVNREDMINAYNGVYKLGYRFVTGYDENNMPTLSEHPDYLYSKDYHEFGCLKKDKDDNCVEIEVKYATSAIPYKYIKDFQQNYQLVDIEDLKIKTFNLTFTFIHICAHLYVNSQCEDGYINDVMFRDFVDLKMFLCKHGEMDWASIYEKAKKYEIIHQLYFALHSINLFWPNTVATDVVESFNPCKITYAYKGNEFGEVYTWGSDIVTRSFDEKLRMKEYSFIYKTDIFNQANTPCIIDDDSTHSFLIEKDNIQIPVFLSYDSTSYCIRIVTLFNAVLFKEEELYFYITLIDNDISQEIIEHIISNPKDIKFENVQGTWDTYIHKDQGINFINIKIEDIFNDKSDKVYVLIDIYKKIGANGFRGTGAKASYIVYNTSKTGE